MDAYLQHVIAATARAAAEARRLGDDLSAIVAEWRQQGGIRHGSVAATIMAGLVQQPVISAADNPATHRTDGTRPEGSTVYRALDNLVATGVLTEITDARRNRVWVATEITAALDDFARRLGRRKKSST